MTNGLICYYLILLSESSVYNFQTPKTRPELENNLIQIRTKRSSCRAKKLKSKLQRKPRARLLDWIGLNRTEPGSQLAQLAEAMDAGGCLPGVLGRGGDSRGQSSRRRRRVLAHLTPILCTPISWSVGGR